MRLKDILDIFHKELDSIYGKNEVNSFFNLLIEHFFDLQRITLIVQPEYTIDKKDGDLMFRALAKLKLQHPIQHIIGQTEFYDLTFNVNKNTLIPRPETEELVRWIVKDHQDTSNKLSILDIGTGSGCISVSLAKALKNAKVSAVDVSIEALEVAKVNAELNNVKVDFIHQDILNWNKTSEFEQEKFDVIVSNPPYVREIEKVEMQANVLDNEPHLALFVGNDDALKFYKTISEFAQIHLKPKSSIYFEINQYLREEMHELMISVGFVEIEIKKDMFGNDRMLKAIKP